MTNLASHNTMTYLPVKQWYLKPFGFMAKCQSKTIFEQYDLGVRCFDIRIRYNENVPEFAHGLITYKENVNAILKAFHDYIKESVTLRIILETNKEDKVQEYNFYCFCRYIATAFSKFNGCGGYRKYDWKPMFYFTYSEPTFDQKVSSMTWKKIDDWFPYLYARLMNKRNVRKGTNKDWLMLDFIHIK